MNRLQLVFLAVFPLLLCYASANYCPWGSTWGGVGLYCLNGHIRWCDYAGQYVTGIYQNCGTCGCTQAPPGSPDYCNSCGSPPSPPPPPGGGGGGSYNIPSSCSSSGYDCVAYARCVWNNWFPGTTPPSGNGGDWDTSLSGKGFYSSSSKSSSQAGFVVFNPCAGGADCFYGHVAVAAGSWSSGCGTIHEGNWNGGYNTRSICLSSGISLWVKWITRKYDAEYKLR